MDEAHDFTTSIRWTGNRGDGNRRYRGYDRTWQVAVPGQAVIEASNDPRLGGDPGKPNPETMLISALASCHMLWFLHLAHNDGVVVTGYEDEPLGHGESSASGAGRFTAATLRPLITLAAGSDPARADAVHARIHEVCFIARSVNFPVRIAARYRVEEAPQG
jgi:organic hydroperoxide reductase OsmC/OhrA